MGMNILLLMVYIKYLTAFLIMLLIMIITRIIILIIVEAFHGILPQVTKSLPR
jgi:hypothetical protein